MKDYKKLFVKPTDTIFQTLEAIDRTQLQFALVVDPSNRLLGVVTDGDIRRSILKRISFESAVSLIMNTTPVVAQTGVSKTALLKTLKSKRLKQIPLVSPDGIITGVEVLDELLEPTIQNASVVLMAGGEGRRLLPLTDSLPKPLIEIGSKPLLETIIESFTELGFKKIYLSVNYKADKIKDYFGDGSKFNCEIHYLEENSPLGTCGALSLLPQPSNQPIIVMNADVLTKTNFSHLLRFHEEQGATATLCVREFSSEVPYGVIETHNEQVVNIVEKPSQTFLINAGIYCFSSQVLKWISKNQRLDMPDLLKTLIAKKEKISAFPIREYWLDIGRMSDLEKAQAEFSALFGKERG